MGEDGEGVGPAHWTQYITEGEAETIRDINKVLAGFPPHLHGELDYRTVLIGRLVQILNQSVVCYADAETIHVLHDAPQDI